MDISNRAAIAGLVGDGCVMFAKSGLISHGASTSVSVLRAI